MAAGNPVHHKPPDVEHGSMVVDMEHGDLVVVLAKDEEKGVHEFDEFGEVVPPEDADDLHIGFSRAACSLAEKVVFAFPHTCHQLIEHVERQQGESKVIQLQDASARERLPVLHVFWSQPYNE